MDSNKRFTNKNIITEDNIEALFDEMEQHNREYENAIQGDSGYIWQKLTQPQTKPIK